MVGYFNTVDLDYGQMKRIRSILVRNQHENHLFIPIFQKKFITKYSMMFQEAFPSWRAYVNRINGWDRYMLTPMEFLINFFPNSVHIIRFHERGHIWIAPHPHFFPKNVRSFYQGAQGVLPDKDMIKQMIMKTIGSAELSPLIHVSELFQMLELVFGDMGPQPFFEELLRECHQEFESDSYIREGIWVRCPWTARTLLVQQLTTIFNDYAYSPLEEIEQLYLRIFRSDPQWRCLIDDPSQFNSLGDWLKHYIRTSTNPEFALVDCKSPTGYKVYYLKCPSKLEGWIGDKEKKMRSRNRTGDLEIFLAEFEFLVPYNITITLAHLIELHKDAFGTDKYMGIDPDVFFNMINGLKRWMKSLPPTHQYAERKGFFFERSGHDCVHVVEDYPLDKIPEDSELHPLGMENKSMYRILPEEYSVLVKEEVDSHLLNGNKRNKRDNKQQHNLKENGDSMDSQDSSENIKSEENSSTMTIDTQDVLLKLMKTIEQRDEDIEDLFDGGVSEEEGEISDKLKILKSMVRAGEHAPWSGKRAESPIDENPDVKSEVKLEDSHARDAFVKEEENKGLNSGHGQSTRYFREHSPVDTANSKSKRHKSYNNHETISSPSHSRRHTSRSDVDPWSNSTWEVPNEPSSSSKAYHDDQSSSQVRHKRQYESNSRSNEKVNDPWGNPSWGYESFGNDMDVNTDPGKFRNIYKQQHYGKERPYLRDASVRRGHTSPHSSKKSLFSTIDVEDPWGNATWDGASNTNEFGMRGSRDDRDFGENYDSGYGKSAGQQSRSRSRRDYRTPARPFSRDDWGEDRKECKPTYKQEERNYKKPERSSVQFLESLWNDDGWNVNNGNRQDHNFGVVSPELVSSQNSRSNQSRREIVHQKEEDVSFDGWGEDHSAWGGNEFGSNQQSEPRTSGWGDKGNRGREYNDKKGKGKQRYSDTSSKRNNQNTVNNNSRPQYSFKEDNHYSRDPSVEKRSETNYRSEIFFQESSSHEHGYVKPERMQIIQADVNIDAERSNTFNNVQKVLPVDPEVNLTGSNAGPINDRYGFYKRRSMNIQRNQNTDVHLKNESHVFIVDKQTSSVEPSQLNIDGSFDESHDYPIDIHVDDESRASQVPSSKPTKEQGSIEERHILGLDLWLMTEIMKQSDASLISDTNLLDPYDDHLFKDAILGLAFSN